MDLRNRVPAGVGGDRSLAAVLGLTALSLLVRVAGLGRRVAHWDEARVAYWVYEYGQTGVLFYRPVVHGPLLKLVNAPLFDLLGATDLVMRLFPAVVGGLLPLVALLFRHRLRDAAVVALALFLALNPALLYYSRFMRNDVLTAAFCFLAFACLVRAVDFDDGRYLYPAAVALAFGFGAKENALAYVLAFVGAAGLLFGHRLVVAYAGGGSPAETARNCAARSLGSVVRHARAVAGSALAFLAVVTYIHAPRGRLPSQGLYYQSCLNYEPFFNVDGGVTLGEAAANPLLLPRLVYFTVGSTAELYACQWIAPRTDDPNPYLEFFGQLGWITVQSSTAVVGLAALGFLLAVRDSGFPGGLPDDLVTYAFYWGAASMVGYPIITDIGGSAWLVVHIVLPLAIPAAYGLATLYGWGLEARADGDVVSVAILVALVVLLVGGMAWTGYSTSFADPKSDDNPLVQFAQPSGDVEGTLTEMRTLADRNDGTDVVLYGDHFYRPTGDAELDRRPACSNWFNALPLPWYFEAGGMTADCAPNEAALETALESDPPVVVAHADERAAVDERLGDRYDRRTFLMRTTSDPVVFYVDESRLK